MTQPPDASTTPDSAIAVIGMALRFPGASDAAGFWNNLVGGVESITIEPAPAGHVTAAGVLEGIEQFDAAFFRYTAGEAAEIDPQQRLFLECAWSALESAGHAPQGRPIRAGVYAGESFSSYLISNLLPAAMARGSAPNKLGFACDFLATRAAYKLGLTGPAVTVQTACSTSLVAIHLACQALIAGECDLALAGGARVGVPQLVSYVYHEGGIASADGHCRAFDARSTGAVPGSGAGVVVLRRLADALADRDPIRAVVIGTAINNDGNAKAGFAAPSVDGQAAAIREAHAIAGVSAADISYVEAHGTATPLGDPIEIAALSQVFVDAPRGSCGIGTVKTNIGHLDAAAGVAGFIKTVLALEHRTLPPSLHFTAPNPRLGIEDSPFFVVAERRAWTGPRPLRAGVSSFGIGGTNAHVVLQEPPEALPAPAPHRDELVVISARTRPALDRMTDALAGVLRTTDAPLADIAHTLQVGRARFAVRRYAVGRDPRALAEALVQSAAAAHAPDDADERDPVFVFPGGGVQRVNMAAALRDEPAFRAAFDDCAERAAGLLGADLRRVVYPDAHEFDAMARALDGPALSQPAIFACNWAIAQLWLAWGVTPRALLGHSLGEYVAACLAGVFSLDDALRLVIARGQILARLPASAMVSVLASPAQVEPLLDPELVIGAINGPATCVIAGPLAPLARLEDRLRSTGIEHRRLRYASAAHTPLLDPHLDGFERLVRGCARHAPALRMVSAVTGTWLTADQATDPGYWRRQLRNTVQFSDALSTLLSSGRHAVIEVGPGATLSALIRQHPAGARHPAIATLPQTGAARPALAALGDAWVAGVPIDWQRLRGDEPRRRVALPTYRFDRERHWIDPPEPATPSAAAHRARPAPPAAPAASPAATVPDGAAPRNDTERVLLACFRELFRIDPIGIHDDFFALGGDSLLAMRLISSIASQLGAPVPLKAIAEAPTVAALAQRIAPRASAGPDPSGEVATTGMTRDSAQRSSCLVQLQQGTRTPPLFFVHGIGGSTVICRDLARAIDPDRRAYGINSRGLDSDEPVHASIEEMASHYIELARAVQPDGPYLLVGLSLGGTVAYEMARQLTARGCAVPLCALLDAPGPGRLPRLDLDSADLLAFEGRGGLPADQLRGLLLDDQIRRALDAAAAAGVALPFSDPAQARRMLAVWQSNARALASYQAPPWPAGEVQFFAPAEQHPRTPADMDRAWIGRCVMRIEVVPGDHMTMFVPPHAATLGARIRRFLDTCAGSTHA